jgi:hypothetical protein
MKPQENYQDLNHVLVKFPNTSPQSQYGLPVHCAKYLDYAKFVANKKGSICVVDKKK